MIGQTFICHLVYLFLCCAQCAEVCNCSLIKRIWKSLQNKEKQFSGDERILKPLILVLLCSVSLFVRRWFHMWRLFCHRLFLIPPSFDASGRLCFVIVTSLRIYPNIRSIKETHAHKHHFLLTAKNNLLFYSKYSRAKITSFASISSSMVKQSHVTGRDENCWNEHCGNILFRKDILTFRSTNSTLIYPGKRYVHFC